VLLTSTSKKTANKSLICVSFIQVLEEVTMVAQAAEKVKTVVQVQKDKAETLVASIAVEKAVAEEKLEEARPALEEAEAALQVFITH